MDFSLSQHASSAVDFLKRFTDATRLLSLHLDAGQPTSHALLIERLAGREALSECYRFECECLSPDAGITPDKLQGRRVGIALNGAAGGARWFNGVITRVEHVGAEGGFARFRFTIEPDFALLGIGRVARTYQDKSVPDLIAEELARWRTAIPLLDWRFDLHAKYPVRSYTVFHQESALAAVSRVAAEEGIGFYFEHLPAEGRQVGLSRVVFFDTVAGLPNNPQASVRFHRADVTEAADTIDRWRRMETLAPGAVALQSFDYKDVISLAAALPSERNSGAGGALMAALTDYAPQTQRYGSGSADLERYARLRMEAYEAHAVTVEGEGCVRSALPGTVFALTGHYAVAAPENRFLLVAVEHDIRNNLPANPLTGPHDTTTSRSSLRREGEPGEGAGAEAGYRNRFTAMAANRPWRPRYDATAHAKPTAPGPQPATVVGPPDSEIHTDGQGRIQVQFHWDPEGRNTCWLRVLTPVAGAGWGTIALPRVGQGVLVDFIQNDIDRPVVLGALYDGDHSPPRFSGAGAYPANRALSGYQSREVSGTGFGELLFDDTTGQTKTKLSSEHGKTQLNQGWIGHPREEGRSEPRGEGFELRTDLAGALRAAQLLLSTEVRPGATGKTLDRQELLGNLEVALAIARQLADLATTHEAGSTDTKAQQELLSGIEQWESRRGANAAPAIAISAPAGIALASAGSVQAAAGTNLDFTAVQDANLSTGRKLALRAEQGFSAFAHREGLRLIAGRDDIRIQAHAGQIELGAAKPLHAYSLETLLFEAPQAAIRAGGCEITLADGTITLSAANGVKIAAPDFNFGGSYSGRLDLPGVPASSLRTDERIALAGRAGQAREAVAYEVKDAEAAVRDAGASAGDGATQTLVTDTAMAPLFLHLKP